MRCVFVAWRRRWCPNSVGTARLARTVGTISLALLVVVLDDQRLTPLAAASTACRALQHACTSRQSTQFTASTRDKREVLAGRTRWECAASSQGAQPHWHGAFPCRAHDVRFVNSTNTLSRFLFCLAEVRKCWAPTDSAYLHIHIHNPHVSTTQHTAVPTLSQAPRTSQLLRGRRCAASPNHTCCQR